MHRYRQAATRESASDEFQQRNSTSLVRTPQSSNTPLYDPIKSVLTSSTNARFLSKQRSPPSNSYVYHSSSPFEGYGQTSSGYGQISAPPPPIELPTAPPTWQGLRNQPSTLYGSPPVVPDFTGVQFGPVVPSPPVSKTAPFFFRSQSSPPVGVTGQGQYPLTQLPDYARYVGPPLDPLYVPSHPTNLGNVISILPGEPQRSPSLLSAHARPWSDKLDDDWQPAAALALPERLTAPTTSSISHYAAEPLPQRVGPDQPATIPSDSNPLFPAETPEQLTYVAMRRIRELEFQKRQEKKRAANMVYELDASKTSDAETTAMYSDLPSKSKVEVDPVSPKQRDSIKLERVSSTSSDAAFFNEKIVILPEAAPTVHQETPSSPYVETANIAPFVDYRKTVRPRPRFTFAGLLQNLFRSTAKPSVDNDPVRKEAARALRNADQAFQMLKQFRSKSIVAEFAVRNAVTRDADITVKSISNHQEFRDIALCPLTQGIRIIYVIDDDVMAESAIKHFFRKASDRNWQRFRTWLSRRRIVRTALQPLSRWMPMEGSTVPMQFAFGLEHPEPFSATQHNHASRLLDVVAAAKSHDVYEKSLFNTVPETPRCMFYYSHEIISGPQVIIIVQNQPFHYQSSEADMKTMSDEKIWTDLLTQRPNPVPAGYMYMVVFDLLKDLLTHIMVETVECWNSRMRMLEEQLNELEKRVYSQPSDDTPSSDLWNLSKHLLAIQQVIGHHAGTMQWAQNTLNTYAMRLSGWDAYDHRPQWDEASQHEWLREYVAEMTFIAENVERNLKEPIEKMLDLMYKSVSIRDARLSLELNASLWRLSWITFVFLPLTFLVGFFGMNVDIFRDFPSAKWYFISAAPFMVFVFAAWFVFKRCLSTYFRVKERRAQMSLKKSS